MLTKFYHIWRHWAKMSWHHISPNRYYMMRKVTMTAVVPKRAFTFWRSTYHATTSRMNITGILLLQHNIKQDHAVNVPKLNAQCKLIRQQIYNQTEHTENGGRKIWRCKNGRFNHESRNPWCQVSLMFGLLYINSSQPSSHCANW